MKNLSFIALFFLAGAVTAFAAGDITGEIDLSKIRDFEVKAHVNEKNAPPPAGSKVKVTSRGLEFDYVFPGKKHDALMASFAVDIPSSFRVTVELTPMQKGHRPYLVLVDAGNENHYMSIVPSIFLSRQTLQKTTRQTFTAQLPLVNKFPGEKHIRHWGGDNNQKMDFPLKKVILGINDYPDEFTGKGKIIFHKITFLSK